ncbi:unnamed protein product, partial [Hymenolepis diminuta]
QICYYYAKKCHSGCTYSKTDTIASQRNSIGSEVSIISLSAVKCFLHRTGLTLQATSNHFFSLHTLLYAIWAPINS